ncbi:LPS-assembly protein LptD [Candidatus Methylopumilus universalis]|uniref:LPS-assembly protein LptD n=1 Tax=Candidatus Methylopumilus universalis TaxID=2588536 RepID=UPI00112250AF|nr:LPS-assembly protein LptD [Candidatus Methylopumilus universalis]QDC79933.1 LPS-assembly protein LptD [Candidatus Methylopumilus universalis]QDC81234.1 LPS-assembly protein LptD [Candidatus Methylopumilus universalis]QDC87671.1 LPS-assembly protein LptD [Candidatus Methylopumilus universalis]
MFRKTISPLWLVFFLLPQLASAEDLATQKQSPEISQGSIEIEGDSLETLLDRKMKAKGNAILKKGNKTIKADVIEYDEVSEKLITTGNTNIDLESMSLRGSKLTLKLSDETGSMEDASFNFKRGDKEEKSVIKNGTVITKRSYDFRGDAKAIFFEGENKKRLQSGRVTTCEADSDDWYLKSSNMEVNTKTDRVNASNAIVEFKGLPVLYTPYINFSLNKNRKSGFLATTVGTTTKSGFDLQIPYYFNISPNMDATVTARYLGKRGPQADGEFRYLEENYSGKNQIQFMKHDEESGKDNRYLVKLEHQHKLNNGWSASYNYQKVSDDAYFSDLATMIQVTSVVNLPQRANINYAGDTWKFNALTEKYQTLTNASNSPYQRLPQLDLSGRKDFDSYILDFKSQWAYFDRDEKFTSTYTDAQRITGSRLTLTPAITVPFTETYGYIKPKLSANVRSYNLNNSSIGNKDILTPIVSVDSGMYFDRTVNLLNQNFTNTLEPRLFYVYIPYKDQSALPNFDTGLADLNMQTLFSENQFNGQDRINDANQLTASIASKFLDKNGKERLSGIVAQRYYFEDRKIFGTDLDAKKANSDIFMGGTARLANSLNLDAMFQYDPTSSKFLRSTLSSRYNPEPGKMLNLSYRMIDNVSDNTQDLKVFNAAGQWPLGNRFYSIGRYNYDIKTAQTIEVLGGIEYDGGCWVARTIFDRISLPTSPQPNYTFFVQLELNGLGTIGSDANKLNNFLYRNVPGVRNVNQIPDVNRQANFN